MIQTELRTVFFDKVKAFANAEGLSVAEPNVAFTKPKRDPVYLGLQALPVIPQVFTVCGESRNRWILQIDVCSRDDTGEINNNEYADQLRSSVFPIHSKLVSANHSFQVMSPPNPAPPIHDDGWYCTPVSLTIESLH